jgi:hypothetical protein
MFAACATKICDNGNACASCGQPLDASNVSVVVYKEPQVDTSLALVGLTPQQIVKVGAIFHKKIGYGSMIRLCDLGEKSWQF